MSSAYLLEQKNNTYILFIENKKHLSLSIGRGLFCNFPPGIYIYIGSARKNIEKRILRHFSKNKKLFWHIDYFLIHTHIINVFIGSLKEKELVSSLINNINLEIPCKGFGSSDSPHPAHLFIIKNKKDVETFLNSLGFKKYK